MDRQRRLISARSRDRWNLGQIHRGRVKIEGLGRSKVKREKPLSEKSCSKAKSFHAIVAQSLCLFPSFFSSYGLFYRQIDRIKKKKGYKFFYLLRREDENSISGNK